MPITKQAIKRMKQDQARTARNRHYNSHMKSMIKLILGYAQKNEADKANKILPKVVSSIDTAAKKKLIHKNNAARKKALVAKAIADMGKGKTEKAAKAKEKEVKKEVKEEKGEEKEVK